jgi:hypothetical protein
MLLALLIYAYCTGQRSSRQIERACEADVAYRVIAANTAPDHTTIARFRQDHEAVARQLFVDVLVLCAAAGLAHVGVIAVDGTKMAATASSKTNRTRAQLEAEVATLFGQAAATDADEDRHFGAARGDELPAELADRARRAARLDAALAALEAQTATRRQGEQAAHQARQARVEAVRRGEPTYGRPPGGQAGVAEAEARLAHAQAADTARWEADDQRRRQAAAAGTSVRGRRPAKKSKRTRRAEKALVGARRRAAQEPPPAPPEARVNVTDPDSRTMKVAQGFIQGYNAQAAANEGGIVVAAEVSQDTGDVGLAVPMMAAVQATRLPPASRRPWARCSSMPATARPPTSSPPGPIGSSPRPRGPSSAARVAPPKHRPTVSAPWPGWNIDCAPPKVPPSMPNGDTPSSPFSATSRTTAAFAASSGGG